MTLAERDQRSQPSCEPLPQYSAPPEALPPVVSSRFNLPVRFPSLWPESLQRQTHEGERLIWDAASYAAGDRLWPVELWEILFGALYREARRRAPRWIEGFCDAVVALWSQDARLNGTDFIEGLSRLTVTTPRGRPRRGAAAPMLVGSTADEGDVLPCDYWEAVFATLYREAKRRDPRWVAGFESALHGVIGRALRQRLPDGSVDGEALLKSLSRFTVSAEKGKPPGSHGAIPAAVWFLRQSFATALTRGWDAQEEQYRPGMLQEIQDVWAIAAGLGFIRGDFPEGATLRTGKGCQLLRVPPLTLTRDVLLPVALQTTGEGIDRSLSRARRWRESLNTLKNMRAHAESSGSPDSA